MCLCLCAFTVQSTSTRTHQDIAVPLRRANTRTRSHHFLRYTHTAPSTHSLSISQWLPQVQPFPRSRLCGAPEPRCARVDGDRRHACWGAGERGREGRAVFNRLDNKGGVTAKTTKEVRHTKHTTASAFANARHRLSTKAPSRRAPGLHPSARLGIREQSSTYASTRTPLREIDGAARGASTGALSCSPTLSPSSQRRVFVGSITIRGGTGAPGHRSAST